ncbi:OprD family porin [Pseudomonas sp. JAI120]|uniref:OprD family porin n=1 Tax=Pseudomonas sp. JAI120 TaxID=2723063 RepID=UPI0030D85B25
MNKNLSATIKVVIYLGAFSLYTQSARADFINDSHAVIDARNMYMNRDFRNSGSLEPMRDWGQGFTLRFNSGFTEGVVGFGVDAIAQMGIKLDAGQRGSTTNLLVLERDGKAENEWSEAGATAKMRFGKSQLSVGSLQPSLPVVMYNDTRLLATRYTGAMFTSKDIDNLSLTFGQLTKVNLRDSTDNKDMAYAYNGLSAGDFDFAGGSYNFSKGLALSYYYGRLEEAYSQNFLGLNHTAEVSPSVKILTDLRYFHSDDEGRAIGGVIDNDFLNGMVTLDTKGHGFSAGWQKLSGDGNFPFLSGADPYSVNLVTHNTFAKQNTKAWQFRYTYNFAAMGIPGLSFMTRYVQGRSIEAGAVTDGHEWERDMDIAYVIQSGPLKDLSLRWRNVSFRSGNGLTTDLDENRVILGYQIALW